MSVVIQNILILSWRDFTIKLSRMDTYLKANLPNYDGLVASLENLRVTFFAAPSQNDISVIETYWGTRTAQVEGTPTQDEILAGIVTIIENAQNFGAGLVQQFAAENVAMGITQAGKTKLVADTLRDVAYYLTTGSLYEAIHAIDSILVIPLTMSPFITTARLAAFKSKIQTYLG